MVTHFHGAIMKLHLYHNSENQITDFSSHHVFHKYSQVERIDLHGAPFICDPFIY